MLIWLYVYSAISCSGNGLTSSWYFLNTRSDDSVRSSFFLMSRWCENVSALMRMKPTIHSWPSSCDALLCIHAQHRWHESGDSFRIHYFFIFWGNSRLLRKLSPTRLSYTLVRLTTIIFYRKDVIQWFEWLWEKENPSIARLCASRRNARRLGFCAISNAPVILWSPARNAGCGAWKPSGALCEFKPGWHPDSAGQFVIFLA